MLNLIAKLSPEKAALTAYYAQKVAAKLGAKVRCDKDSNRYFIKTKRRQYILSARMRKKRKPEIVYGETYKGYHAGYLSFYREYKDQDRGMFDIPMRYEDE